MSEEERAAAERAETERVEAERAEAERVEAERREAEGGGGGGEGEGGTELQTALDEATQLREENTALAEQNRELMGGMTDEGDLAQELADERAARRKLQTQVDDMQRGTAVDKARAEILKEQPELAEHLDLIGEDDPEKMKERAGKLKKFGAERLAASRAAAEREVAEKFGVPLGSTAEEAAPPEEVEARQKAIDAGDAGAVAGQVVEKELEKLV